MFGLNALQNRLSMFCLTLVVLVLHTQVNCQTVTERIKLNQLGFYPNAPKIAIVTGSTAATTFYVTSTNLRDTIFKGALSNELQSKNSATKTKVADFTAVHQNGNFVVFVSGVGHSYVFEIGPKVNKPAAVSALKGYYYQRASMPLETQYAGKWHRSAGHPDTAVYIHPSAATQQRPANSNISTPGGWYDAGDYNKYIVNSGISMGTLLSAYEDFPHFFQNLATNIPESADQVPDILNECIYNLRWMLTMQDTDGGVYNKCTNASFDGMVMPGITTAPRYVVQKGTAATLDLAAVTAQASRLLGRFNKMLPGLSDSCLKASLAAWKWANNNPELQYDQDAMNKQFSPKVTTGGYGDRQFNDEWAWAAAELFATTGNQQYFNKYKSAIKDQVSLQSWSNVEMLGHLTLLRLKDKLPAYTRTYLDSLQTRLIAFADALDNHETNAFKTVMGKTPNEFNWGSNSNAANQGLILVNAYLLTGKKKYVDLALSNVDYLLGRNATGYCFLSGLGSKPIMHPHHRQSVADGVTEPVPGLLSGGPNPGKQDKCAYEFSEPETTFSDADCSFASNEIAINWNAPFVYLVSAIEALQDKVGYTR